ncbi:MAG: transporter substrate-binding domain-containing protein [Hydrogenophaga sp.]|nr:transporter substrate-binding domain-containing protein [Hydrogenophaga sp.]
MRSIFLSFWLLTAFHVQAADPLRVAVVGNAPPMSYVGENGQLTGFNVELARALCEVLEARCEFRPHQLQEVVDVVARGQVDFAVVSLLVTPERRSKVLFTQPVYRSLSVWLSNQAFPTAALPARPVSVVQGSVQHAYGQARQWPMTVLGTHTEVFEALSSGQAHAALLPMTSGMNVIRDRRFGSTGLSYQLIAEPALSGEVAISVTPKRPRLLEQLNDGLDKLKRNGRFDRINTEFLPFRLQ